MKVAKYIGTDKVELDENHEYGYTDMINDNVLWRASRGTNKRRFF